ncbi:MAG: hypothetical protein K9J30_05245 [Bacteroidales bacterium]|nr:hypothetical protein [Bacteroidales bacterium]
MKVLKQIILLLLLCFNHLPVVAQQIAFDGQVIGWTITNPGNPFQLQGGARYIPEINFNVPVGRINLGGEISLDTWGTATYVHDDSLTTHQQLKPYRAWLKFSGNRFELRAGLQKINFGSARMIRPLMWFDRLDPKDPLQLTAGVYGLLGRYYFLNNANIWIWGLYGNNETKGLEMFPSKKNSIEYGGRLQLPIPVGELAFTFHHRTADPDAMLPVPMHIDEFCPENRFAFDTKIDAVAGIWFEGALIRKQEGLLDLDNATLLNAGLDYTFNLGNGITAVGEALYYMQGEEAFRADQDILFSGISVNYPLSIIQNLSAMVFYDAFNNEFYRFINWSATFDRWSFYAIGFWNPDRYQIPGFQQETNIFSGAGLQLMAVFNY